MLYSKVCLLFVVYLCVRIKSVERFIGVVYERENIIKLLWVELVRCQILFWVNTHIFSLCQDKEDFVLYCPISTQKVCSIYLGRNSTTWGLQMSACLLSGRQEGMEVRENYSLWGPSTIDVCPASLLPSASLNITVLEFSHSKDSPQAFGLSSLR